MEAIFGIYNLVVTDGAQLIGEVLIGIGAVLAALLVVVKALRGLVALFGSLAVMTAWEGDDKAVASLNAALESIAVGINWTADKVDDLRSWIGRPSWSRGAK